MNEELEFAQETIRSQADEIESLRLEVSDRLRQIDRLYDESYDVMKDQKAKIDHLNLIIKQIIEITGLIISCDETAIAGRGEVFELGKHYPELFAYMMTKLIETEY